KVARLHCRGCGRVIERDSPESVFRRLPEGASFLVLFAVSAPERLPWSDVRGGLERAGFHRLLVDGQIGRLDTLHKKPRGGLQAAVARLVARPAQKGRSDVARERAFPFGRGPAPPFFREENRRETFSTELECPRCEIRYRDPSANLFSFNSPLGAC